MRQHHSAPLSAEEVRRNRQVRRDDADLRLALGRVQAGQGTDADWQRILPEPERQRRTAVRAHYPLGARVDLRDIIPLAAMRGATLDRFIDHLCSALAGAGLGGMRADGDVDEVLNDDEPAGYDPLTHEIWMDVRWCRGLEQFLDDPHRHALKAVTLHAMVHEHVHVNSPINAHLGDRSFLDPAQMLIEEACVDTLARNITARIVGHELPTRAYGALSATMRWLRDRCARDVAFEIWREPTLGARIAAANRAILEALGVAPSEALSGPAHRLRDWLLGIRDDLFLLLDAPEVLHAVETELRRRPGLFGSLLVKRHSDAMMLAAGVLADRRRRRASAMKGTPVLDRQVRYTSATF